MKKFIKHSKFIFILLFLPFYALSLPTQISGKVISGNGLVIRALVYIDKLSNSDFQLGMQEIASNELFNLRFEISGIQEVTVKIANQSFSFFAEEGKSYQMEIDNLELPPKSSISEQKPLHIVWSKPDVLNEVIGVFDYTFSSFLEKNFIAIYKYRDAKLLQSFENEMLNKLKETTNLSTSEKKFFDDYLNYQFADLKNASQTLSDQKLGEIYLKNKEILYDNPAYMLFFRHYFNQYFTSGKRNIAYNQVLELTKKSATIGQLMDLMKKDPILLNEQLRELVLLYALKDVFYNTEFNSLYIKHKLSELSEKSKFAKNQKIAGNILKQLSQMQIGEPAPDFKLKSTSGSVKSLADYSGRYVYLVFISDNCPACEAEMELLKDIHSRYQKNIAVVCILVNYTKTGLSKVIEKTKSPGDRLLFNNDFELLNTYSIRNFPHYLLIDREGKILQQSARKPHEGIDKYFDFLIRKDAEKSRKPDSMFR